MPGSFKLARLGGIEFAIHYTWLLAFALITWSLAEGFFPTSYPGFSPATYWLIGAIAAVLLFASVLVHEISHSVVAIWCGQGVRSITLFVFGGISNLQSEAPTARDEFLVSVVGPLTSFVLAAIFWAVDQTMGAANSPQKAILDYLIFINFALGVFNIIPGFPLDGGRVLRSIVWAATGNLRRATRIASAVGQIFGFMLIGWGIWRFLGGDLLGGLWTVFIGWFLNSAADATRQQQAMTEDLRGVPVRQLMNPEPPTVEPEMSIREFVLEEVLRRGHRAVLVMHAGKLVGLMTLADAKELPPEDWERTPVGQVMTLAPLKTVSPDAGLSAAMKLLVDDSLHQLPVLDDGRVVGILDRGDVLRFLQLRDELEVALGPERELRRRPRAQAESTRRAA